MNLTGAYICRWAYNSHAWLKKEDINYTQHRPCLTEERRHKTTHNTGLCLHWQNSAYRAWTQNSTKYTENKSLHVTEENSTPQTELYKACARLNCTQHARRQNSAENKLSTTEQTHWKQLSVSNRHAAFPFQLQQQIRIVEHYRNHHYAQLVLQYSWLQGKKCKSQKLKLSKIFLIFFLL